jgi:hypothetical protein
MAARRRSKSTKADSSVAALILGGVLLVSAFSAASWALLGVLAASVGGILVAIAAWALWGGPQALPHVKVPPGRTYRTPRRTEPPAARPPRRIAAHRGTRRDTHRTAGITWAVDHQVASDDFPLDEGDLNAPLDWQRYRSPRPYQPRSPRVYGPVFDDSLDDLIGAKR